MKTVTTEKVVGHSFRYKTTARQHSWIADAAAPKGGDTAANPVEHLMGALAECIAMTAESIASNKSYPVTHIRVTVTMDEIDDPAGGGKKIPRFKEHLDVEGPLTDAQMDGLKHAMKVCTVFKIMDGKKSFDPSYNLVRPVPAVSSDSTAVSAMTVVASQVVSGEEESTAAPVPAAPRPTATGGGECKS
ncbi:MAG: OsmC family protein [Candidatus Obscuribacterales bacterium]|nr:OsmC family protein [Candidatus Obscuribacterales bacterium]